MEDGWVAASGFPAKAGRYHLYISWACPWVHRTANLRRLKEPEGAVSLSSAEPFMSDDDWAFSNGSGVPRSTAWRGVLREIFYIKADIY